MTSTRTAAVVISGDDVYEDLFTAAATLEILLADLGFSSRARMGLASVASGEPAPDLIVLFTAVGEFTPEQQRRVRDAVRDGAGLVALHSTSVFPASGDFAVARDLIGSEYVSHGAEPHESRFRVELSPTNDLTRDLPGFELTHEHYETRVTADVDVIAWRDAGTHREPLVHLRRHGSGRVAYLQFGHDMRAFGEPGVRRIIGRVAEWAARGGTAADRAAARTAQGAAA